MCENRVQQSDVVGWSDAGIDGCGGSWQVTPHPSPFKHLSFVSTFNSAFAAVQTGGRRLFDRMRGRKNIPRQCGPVEFENKICTSYYGNMVNGFHFITSGWNCHGPAWLTINSNCSCWPHLRSHTLKRSSWLPDALPVVHVDTVDS